MWFIAVVVCFVVVVIWFGIAERNFQSSGRRERSIKDFFSS